MSEPTNTEILEAIKAVHERLDAMEGKSRTAEYLTVQEAAAEFKLSVGSLYRMKNLHHRRGRSVRFRRTDLVKLMRPDPLAKNG